jgi:hypothetical protein
MFSVVFAVQFMPADRRKFCNKKKFEHCFCAVHPALTGIWRRARGAPFSLVSF